MTKRMTTPLNYSIEQIRANMNDPEWVEQVLDEARAEGARKQAEVYQQHLDFHGVPALRMVVVERRRGYRGRTVCADCYFGKEWR